MGGISVLHQQKWVDSALLRRNLQFFFFLFLMVLWGHHSLFFFFTLHMEENLARILHTRVWWGSNVGGKWHNFFGTLFAGTLYGTSWSCMCNVCNCMHWCFHTNIICIRMHSNSIQYQEFQFQLFFSKTKEISVKSFCSSSSSSSFLPFLFFFYFLYIFLSKKLVFLFPPLKIDGSYFIDSNR